jgi:hypothetical protein
VGANLFGRSRCHFAVGMHVVLALAEEHGPQLEHSPVHNFVKKCAHDVSLYWGLMVRAVNLAVPKSWANFLVRWEPLHGVTMAAAFTHFQVQTERAHEETKGVVQVCIMTYHLIQYADNERPKKIV